MALPGQTCYLFCAARACRSVSLPGPDCHLGDRGAPPAAGWIRTLWSSRGCRGCVSSCVGVCGLPATVAGSAILICRQVPATAAGAGRVDGRDLRRRRIEVHARYEPFGAGLAAGRPLLFAARAAVRPGARLNRLRQLARPETLPTLVNVLIGDASDGRRVWDTRRQQV